MTDSKKRLDLARRAQTQGWTQPQLLEEVRKVSGKLTPTASIRRSKKLKRPSLGLLFHYRIVEETSLNPS